LILTAALEAADISSLELQTFAACCLMLIAGRHRDAAQNMERGELIDCRVMVNAIADTDTVCLIRIFRKGDLL
jgi:hypothetical protein